MPYVLASVGVFLVNTIGLAATDFLFKFIGVQLLNVVSSKLFGPKTPKGAGLTDIQVTTRSALEHRKIVYGQAMVSGPIVYSNLSGSSGEYLWQVVALADGESEDFISLYLDGDAIPKADIAWTAGTGGADGTGTGDVSTSKWVGANSTKGVQAYYYLGEDAQPASGKLNPTFADWSTAHRLRGVTYVITKFLYNEDTENVWKGGPPSNIKALLKGRKIYDPRLDTTNGGSGSHRYTDSTTWEWSENPALCVADYLVNFMGVNAETSINWTSIADAADDCAVSVVIPPATSPETTEARFTCNGALSLGSSHKDNLDSILSSCDGKLSYSGGEWKLRASVWEASSVSIDEDDLAGDLSIRGSSPQSERFNTIRGFFIDPARNYEAVEFPHVANATYLTRDNSETLTYDLQLPMTNTESMAQRIAIRNLEKGNRQIVVELTMNARGAKVAIGDVVDLTVSELGWSSKTFRCIEWAMNPDSTFRVALREDDASAYTDPVVGDYGTAASGGVTVPSDAIPAPTSLAATAVTAGIKLTWTNPPASTYDFIEVYEDTNSSWAGATKIAEVSANTITIPKTDTTAYYYWIRAVRLPSLQSLRNPDSDTTTITASATASGGIGIGDLDNFTLTENDAIGDNDGTATVGFRVDADGDLYTRGSSDSSYTSAQTWLPASGTNSDFEVKVSKVSQGRTSLGDASNLDTGTLDTWQVCSTDRTFEVSSTSPPGADKGGYYDVTWRRTSDNLELATIRADLWAYQGP